jgi:hypothetical protein
MTRRTRQPKALIGWKSHPLTFRVSDQLHEDIAKAARNSGRLMNDEARYRLIASFEFDRIMGVGTGPLTPLDKFWLAGWAVTINRLMTIEGALPLHGGPDDHP